MSLSTHSTLNTLIQSIHQSSSLPQGNKTELIRLLGQLDKALHDAPKEHEETVVSATATLIDNANRQRPDASAIQESVSALEEAIVPLKEDTPVAYAVAMDIVTLTQGGSA